MNAPCVLNGELYGFYNSSLHMRFFYMKNKERINAFVCERCDILFNGGFKLLKIEPFIFLYSQSIYKLYEWYE